jgi:hypothetical protein
MPAIDPVDRKNSAMPRRRVNQWLMTGVSATGLVKARPTDSSTPNDSRKVSGVARHHRPQHGADDEVVPSSSTGGVPKRAIR